MGLFDFIFGNKKKAEQERLERERQAELQRKENERIAREREARLAENRRKEEERKARIFEENSKKYQILDFYLDCSHWNKQNTILEQTPLALPIKRIDVENQDDIVKKYKVNNLPKLILVDLNGKEVKRWKGITEAEEINDFLYENGYAIRKESSSSGTFTPFTFTSNQHLRYENGSPVHGLQNCIRTVSVEVNKNGCNGYKLEPGDGYIVKIFNNDLNRPLMADKPMRIYRQSATSVELRGYSVVAQTPFGWQEHDLSDYGLIVYYESGIVSKCVLHMYDRNTFIEYRKISNESIEKPTSTTSFCEAEQYAMKAREAAKNGNTSMAHRLGIEAFRSFVSDISQVKQVKDIQCCALALGKMMEGDSFTDNETISRAVAISYYFLTKAIKQCSNKDPYLFVYRFSLTYEYNKAFYSLFAHSEGEEISYSPFDIMGQSAMMAYEHHLQGMQMCDMFTEPRVGQLDNALNNIFHQIWSRYSKTNPEEVKRLGNQYHDKIFNYIEDKIKKEDLSF